MSDTVFNPHNGTPDFVLDASEIAAIGDPRYLKLDQTTPQTTTGIFNLTPRIAVDINRYGFLNQTETTIAFDGTKIFTLGSVGASWSYYRAGIKYTITGSKTIDLTTVDATLVDGAIYFIYIDATNGTLSASRTSWTLNDTKVPVATILWNNTLTPKYWLSDERHTCLIDRRDHYIEHFTEGCKIKSRGALTGYTLDTDTNAAKTFEIAETVMLDEDIIHTEAYLPDPNGTATDYVVFYRTAASTWAWKSSNMPFVYNVGNTNNYIQYDNSGTMTDIATARWVNSYLLVTNIDGAARYALIMGQAQFSSLAAAQAESPSAFTLTGFPIVEAAFMYRLTWEVSSSYTSQGHCRMDVAPSALSLAAVSNVGNGASIDHGSLQGLLDDDHPQYLRTNQTTPQVVTATDSTITASDEIYYGDVSDSSKIKKDTIQGILDLVPVSSLPAGIINGWGGNIASVPSGYLFCNGAAVSRSTFSALFAAIGTIWGAGDGSTTFNLPDSRDKFTVGAKEDDSGVPKTNIAGTLLQTGGAKDHVHTAYDSGHSHNLAYSGGASGIRFPSIASVDNNADGSVVSYVPVVDEYGWTGCNTLITEAGGSCGYTDMSCGNYIGVDSADVIPPFISYPSIITV